VPGEAPVRRAPFCIYTGASSVARLRNHARILNLTTENCAALRAEVVCRKISYLSEFPSHLNRLDKVPFSVHIKGVT
jgi:hypothetical protein